MPSIRQGPVKQLTAQKLFASQLDWSEQEPALTGATVMDVTVSVPLSKTTASTNTLHNHKHEKHRDRSHTIHPNLPRVILENLASSDL